MPDFALDLASLRAAYAAGTTPAQVLESVYARIAEADDPGIFITLVPKADALGQAAALGAFGPARPLWGVPVAVKDNIDVAGLPTTAACPAFAFTPAAHAACVARLLAAGAIVIGKTNLDQFATGLVGVRTPYPAPRNAFDPAVVPGGSSSGSAVALARGLVSLALGTDTAGSGRVPAGLNNVVGLKPSVGAISMRGVFPACRTLDVVSIFALTVDDAWAAFDVMAGADAVDAFSRPIVPGALTPAPPALRLGVPRADDLEFFGDDAAAAAWERSVALLESLGAQLVPVDMRPFLDAARLLYDGPWVAERHAALRAFFAGHAAEVHPVTRAIVEGATRISATDAFDGLYQVAEIRRQTEPLWHSIDALAVPTAPLAPRVAELEADPITSNARLGRWTNFVNLLDLAALAVPGSFRPDGLPAGLTLVGPRGSDAALASVGRLVHSRAGVPAGATGRALPPLAALPEAAGDAVEIVVVGAHLSGMPLNRELKALGAVFRRAVTTAPSYKLFALPGGPPKRPGLLRVGEGLGHGIATEVWALPPEGFGRFVAAIPAPLAIGTVRLADGTQPKGFLVEPAGLEGAEDISSFGSWRAFTAAA